MNNDFGHMNISRGLSVIVFALSIQISHSQGLSLTEPQRLYERAVDYYDKEDFVNAYHSVQKSIELAPANTEAYLLRARLHEFNREYDKALPDYTVYIERRTEQQLDIYEALFLRAQLYHKTSRYEEALADFKRLLKLKPRETNVILYRQTRFEPGIDRIMTAHQHVRDDIYQYMGLCYLEMKQYPNAVLMFDSAIFINPRDADYYYHKGFALQQSALTALAIKQYHAALGLEENHAAAVQQLALLEDGENTLERLSAGIEVNPTYPYSYFQRAQIYMAQNNNKLALDDYNRGIELLGKDSDVFVNRALLKEKLRDFDGAEQDYLKAIDIQVNNEKAYLNLANLYVKRRQYQESIPYYNLAIFYYPAYALAYFNRSIANYYLRNLDSACADLTRALELGYQTPENMAKEFCK